MWILFIAAALALQLYANALLFYLGSSANWWWPYDVLDWFRYLGVMGLGAAAVFALRGSRWASAIAAAAAACGLYWFIRVEAAIPVGSWQHWNDIAPEEKTWQVALPMFVVVFVVWALAAVVLKFAGRPPQPAAVAGFVALLGWYLTCAHPYDIATISHHGIDLRVLHLEKHGLWIRETTVTMDPRYPAWIRESERRLLQFRWPATTAESTMRPSKQALLDSLRGLEPLRHEPSLPSAWHAEAWFVTVDDKLYALPSQGNPAVKAFVQEVQASPKQRVYADRETDICLGFCFEPMVALGYRLRAERMRVIGKIRQQ